MQVRAGFLLLDNSISGFAAPLAEGCSHGRVFSQVRWCEFREPSSRRSTAGSIAALVEAVSLSTLVPVVPPFNGGLHCGDIERAVMASGLGPSSRRSTAGSIAARRTSRGSPGR
jgi:hypothetical protein